MNLLDNIVFHIREQRHDLRLSRVLVTASFHQAKPSMSLAEAMMSSTEGKRGKDQKQSLNSYRVVAAKA